MIGKKQDSTDFDVTKGETRTFFFSSAKFSSVTSKREGLFKEETYIVFLLQQWMMIRNKFTVEGLFMGLC